MVKFACLGIKLLIFKEKVYFFPKYRKYIWYFPENNYSSLHYLSIDDVTQFSIITHNIIEPAPHKNLLMFLMYDQKWKVKNIFFRIAWFNSTEVFFRFGFQFRLVKLAYCSLVGLSLYFCYRSCCPKKCLVQKWSKRDSKIIISLC